MISNNPKWFKVYGIYISEETAECKPDCNPLAYSVTLKSTKGSLKLDKHIATLNYDENNGLQRDGTTYIITFKGQQSEVNKALDFIYFSPYCPFDPDLQLDVVVTAWGD